jgi:hypothetical protein
MLVARSRRPPPFLGSQGRQVSGWARVAVSAVGRRLACPPRTRERNPCIDEVASRSELPRADYEVILLLRGMEMGMYPASVVVLFRRVPCKRRAVFVFPPLS